MTIDDMESFVRQIRAASKEVQAATHRRDQLVRKMRQAGGTWTEIGYALGMSAQGAQQRYGNGNERAEAHREKAAKRRVKKVAKKAAPKAPTTPEPRSP